MRELNNRTFEHLHRLSLRFHLERRTGGLSRVIERATRGVELIIRMGILNVVPTALELLLVVGMLLYYFDWRYVVIVLATVAVYMWFTFAASERRIAIRREMNDSDTDANTKAIDSLLNFETVKYFGNEEHGGAPLRCLHGALRAGGDQDLPLARRAQLRPGADLHRRHDARACCSPRAASSPAPTRSASS